MRRYITSSVALVALLLSGATKADESLEYATVGNWSIAVDRSLDNGCFMAVSYTDGPWFRIGFDRREDSSFYIMLGDEKWKSIEYGKTYRISITFGRKPKWEGPATGFSFSPPDNEGILILYIDKGQYENFLKEAMEERHFVAHYEERVIGNFSLKDSFRAGIKMIECHSLIAEYEAKTEEKHADEDPFKTLPATSGDDPFKL